MENRKTKQKIKAHIMFMEDRQHIHEVLSIESACFSDPWTKEDFEKCEGPRISSMVAIYEGKVVGFMVYEVKERYILIKNFAVDPKMQRRGVGSQMTERLKSKLGFGKKTKIMLVVRETNLTAQLFFRSQGFLAVNGVQRDYFEDGEDAYLLEFSIKVPSFNGKNRMAEYLP